VVKAALRTILVPRPRTSGIGGQPIRDADLLRWAREVVDAVVDRGTEATRSQQ
jgi:transcription-repair coupling factor (superfamily II helicase)